MYKHPYIHISHTCIQEKGYASDDYIQIVSMLVGVSKRLLDKEDSVCMYVER